MISQQTNLMNFSVSKEFLCNFKDFEYDLLIDENGTIRTVFPCCPSCGSPVSDNGSNPVTNKRVLSIGLNIKKGRTICSNPKCDFSYSISQEITNEWLDEFEKFISLIIKSLGTKYLSSDAISQHIKEVYRVEISGEYIRIKLNEFIKNLEIPMPPYRPSNVLIHDEQYVKIKGIDMKRISVVDPNNANVYYDILHSDMTEETIRSVAKEMKLLFPETFAVVLDGLCVSHKAYRNEFGKNLLIQRCLFHFLKNLRKAFMDESGFGKGKIVLPLDQLIKFFTACNLFFGHERELHHLRNLQEELDANINRVYHSKFPNAQKLTEDWQKRYAYKAVQYLSEIRKARRRKKGIKLILRTEKQAKMLLEKAKAENEFPKEVQRLLKVLETNWDNFTHCMRHENIPPTSNKVEQFFALTLNWIEKNNLQSEDQFYKQKKISLYKRYRINLFEEGQFMRFLKKTFAFILTFGMPP